MTYRYVKAPPGFQLAPQLGLRQKLRFGLSLLLITLGVATFTTVAYPLISYQIVYAPRFQQSDIISPLSASPLKQAKADETPTFVDEVINNSLDYTDSSSWFYDTQKPAQASSPLSYVLSIPKLGIDHAVVRNDHTDLKQSLIQYGGTAAPGDLGNTVIFGHSVLPQFFNPKNYLTIFSTLHTLRPGDLIEITADGATYEYKIGEMYEASPDDLSPLAQVYNDRTLTLITCTPPGTYLRRLIIKAHIL